MSLSYLSHKLNLRQPDITPIIKQKFSKVAVNYDKYALIQKDCGNALLKKIQSDAIFPQRILDIGTGTGNLLKDFSGLYPEATIYGLDISFEMLVYARQKQIKGLLIGADAQTLPFKNKTFDLITSNFTLQWLVNKSESLREIFRLLKSKGNFYFTTFGPRTLRELKTIFPVLKTRFRLNSILEWELMLKKEGFSFLRPDVVLKEELYPNMIEIVRWLKNIGANYIGYMPTKSLGMRSLLNEKDKIYRKYFSNNGSVYATFEIIFISAKKE